MSPEHRTLISSVQRALKVVDIVANAARPLPVKAVAQASGLSLGTTYNLARTLVHEGYLLAEPDGLVLGSRFPSLRGTDAGVFLARVRQTLRLVAGELDSTAYLARFRDGEVHMIDVVDATGAPRVEPWVGISASPHATALGRQILAQLSREQRTEFLARHAPDVHAAHAAHAAAGRRPRRGAWEHPADAPANTGTHAVLAPRRDPTAGRSCLAVPVRAPGVIAALAVAVPGERAGTELGAFTLQLRRSANTLAVQLGAERLAQVRA